VFSIHETTHGQPFIYNASHQEIDTSELLR